MDFTMLFSEAAKLGFGILALTFAVVYLVRRDNAMQTSDRARTDKAIADQNASCERREKDMTERIRQLEDKRHDETSALLRQSVNALETHARVMEKLVDHDTGTHLALNSKARS